MVFFQSAYPLSMVLPIEISLKTIAISEPFLFASKTIRKSNMLQKSYQDLKQVHILYSIPVLFFYHFNKHGFTRLGVCCDNVNTF